MADVRGDLFGPPHGTTPVAVIANKHKTESRLHVYSYQIKFYKMYEIR